MTPLGITMGDPSGVGPEIVCKALAALPDARRAECIVVGDPAFLARANQVTTAGVAFGDHPGAVPVVAVELGVSSPDRR